MRTDQIEELYRIIAAPMMRFPDELLIYGQRAGEYCVVTVTCHPDDQGRLIGAGGRMYKACEHLIAIAGKKAGIHARLVIKSEFRSTHELRPFEPKENWNRTDNEYVEALLWDVLVYVGIDPIDVRVSNASKWKTVALVSTPEVLTDQMRLSLETVFNAIGKGMGRYIYLDIAYEGASQSIGAR